MGDGNASEVRIKVSADAEQAAQQLERMQKGLAGLGGTKGPSMAGGEAGLSKVATAAKHAAAQASVLEKSAESLASKWAAAGTAMVSKIPLIGPQLSGLTSGFAPLLMQLGAVASAVTATWSAFRKFGEAQTPIAKLDAALANSGQLTERYRSRLQELAKQKGNETATPTATWTAALTRLTQFGANSSNIDEYADAVKNLAGIMGGDIESAAVIFGKAMVGSTTMLRRLGIEVDKTLTKEEQLASIMRQLSARGGGQMDINSKTIEGSLTNLSKAFAGIWKGFGNLISQFGVFQWMIDVATKGARALSSVLPKTTEQVTYQANRYGNKPLVPQDEMEAMGEAMGKGATKTKTLADEMKALADSAAAAYSKLEALTKLKLETELLSIEQKVASGQMSDPDAARARAAAEHAAIVENIRNEQAGMNSVKTNLWGMQASANAELEQARTRQAMASEHAGLRNSLVAVNAKEFGGDVGAMRKWANDHKDGHLTTDRVRARVIVDNLAAADDAAETLRQANSAVAQAETKVAALKDEEQKLTQDQGDRTAQLSQQQVLADDKLRLANTEAARKTDRRSALWRTEEEDAAKTSWDHDSQRLLNWQKNFAQGKENGMDEGEAKTYADAKTYAADEENVKKQEALQLELRINEAKAAGNEQEERRLEWIKEYQRVLAEAQGMGLDFTDADSAGKRSANAKDASRSASPADSSLSRLVTSSMSGASVARIAAYAIQKDSGEKIHATLQTFFDTYNSAKDKPVVLKFP